MISIEEPQEKMHNMMILYGVKNNIWVKDYFELIK